MGIREFQHILKHTWGSLSFAVREPWAALSVCVNTLSSIGFFNPVIVEEALVQPRQRRSPISLSLSLNCVITSCLRKHGPPRTQSHWTDPP